MISKKRLVFSIKLISVIMSFILIFIFIPSVLSKYQSITSSNANIDIAFYVIDSSMTTESLVMKEIVPSEEPYIYTFTVQNYNNKGRLETKAKYSVSVISTTNIPFRYELYKVTDTNKENISLGETIYQDDDLMYFRKILSPEFEFGFTDNQMDLYQLYIYYPVEYDSYIYQNIVENINITIESKQILEDDN